MATIRERNTELIIEKASQLFAQHGYAGTKTIDIANSTGLPKANIYYYFQTKQNLYRTVLETITEPLLQAYKPLYETEDPAQALTNYIHTKIKISQSYPHASKIFANEIIYGALYLPKDITSQMKNNSEKFCARIQSWIDTGKMRTISPQHLLFMLWSSTQTYADFNWQISHVMGKDQLQDNDYEEAAKVLTEVILSGCGLKAPD